MFYHRTSPGTDHGRSGPRRESRNERRRQHFETRPETASPCATVHRAGLRQPAAGPAELGHHVTRDGGGCRRIPPSMRAVSCAVDYQGAALDPGAESVRVLRLWQRYFAGRILQARRCGRRQPVHGAGAGMPGLYPSPLDHGAARPQPSDTGTPRGHGRETPYRIADPARRRGLIWPEADRPVPAGPRREGTPCRSSRA